MNTQATSIHSLNHHAAKHLRQWREQLNMSRPKFAAQLGIPPTTLKNYELENRGIGGGLFLPIANHPAQQQHSQWLLTGLGLSPLEV